MSAKEKVLRLLPSAVAVPVGFRGVQIVWMGKVISKVHDLESRAWRDALKFAIREEPL